MEAEVVGIRDRNILLMPSAGLDGLCVGAPVFRSGHGLSIPASMGMLGRVLDALGRPIDEGGPIEEEGRAQLQRASEPALQRPEIDTPLWTGVRAIDGLNTLGRGQRIGVFAGSGVGKSTLLAQIARGCDAECTVLALIGERNREVKSFLRDALGDKGLERSVAVVATSDCSPLERYRAAFSAVAIAEFLRDRGNDVLLVMDSITRFALACREIGLATGESSTVRGYTPTFFATLPKLVERLGRTHRGSITGLFTVLIDADSMDDPVGDTLRGLLDGHLILNRERAREGLFPAIDPLESLSRLMDDVADEDHCSRARRIRELLAILERNRDLVQIGAYKPGTHAALDEALGREDRLRAFLTQAPGESSSREETLNRLQEVLR